MSWGLFKRNILRQTNPVRNPSLDINQVATIWATEYDAAVKRGKDFINFESIQTGNVEIMKTLFRAALLKGLTTPPGVPFSLVNEFGNGVKAYWAGAQMNPFPIPLIPASRVTLLSPVPLTLAELTSVADVVVISRSPVPRAELSVCNVPVPVISLSAVPLTDAEP